MCFVRSCSRLYDIRDASHVGRRGTETVDDVLFTERIESYVVGEDL